MSVQNNWLRKSSEADLMYNEFCKLILNFLTWLSVELHIKVTLRAVFHPHCDQSLGDLKCRSKKRDKIK